MVRALEAKGQLRQAVDYAANKTAETEASLMQNGMPAPQAQEWTREQWAFLPAEEDQPELPNGHPSSWLIDSGKK
jgi:hypothetical protein